MAKFPLSRLAKKLRAEEASVKVLSVLDSLPNQYFLNDSLHHNAGLSHKTKLFCSFQYLLLSHSSRSKFHNTLASMSLISLYARLRPIQFLGPTLKGWRTARLSL